VNRGTRLCQNFLRNNPFFRCLLRGMCQTGRCNGKTLFLEITSSLSDLTNICHRRNTIRRKMKKKSISRSRMFARFLFTNTSDTSKFSCRLRFTCQLKKEKKSPAEISLRERNDRTPITTRLGRPASTDVHRRTSRTGRRHTPPSYRHGADLCHPRARPLTLS